MCSDFVQAALSPKDYKCRYSTCRYSYSYLICCLDLTQATLGTSVQVYNFFSCFPYLVKKSTVQHKI